VSTVDEKNSLTLYTDRRLFSRGSAIARIIGNNVARNDRFETVIKMYVYEEQVDGRNLSEIINTEHENVKYLKGKKLPENIVSVAE